MEITDAIIHRLHKEQHTSGPESVQIHARADQLPLDETLESVCKQTLLLFNRKGNNTGTFGENEDVHRFPIRVQECLDEWTTFVEFTGHAVEIIKGAMSKASAANGGHAFFVRYKAGADEFLMVAMLKLREGAGIDEDSLGLLPTLVIDTDKLHEAARLNITRWKNSEEPYLTFIKGKGADEVTAYFREALACESYTSGRHHTSQVIAAAEAYVKSLALSPEQ
ncbi:nucleoid-associated protein [Stenotrophomonas sp. PS02289]|uniref:nucleoid-associated protein n=1 Tax=Stenotrophomonas sp. PS02289 TaxID=2991422 RepID=UPI00249C6EB2|nr:nucleoid-associated protein [Stenotrophomonas sp. PS02289]